MARAGTGMRPGFTFGENWARFTAELTDAQVEPHRGEGREAAVIEGSVLDPELIERLEPAQLVYARGALHHTGDRWRAIEHAERRGWTHVRTGPCQGRTGADEFVLEIPEP